MSPRDIQIGDIWTAPHLRGCNIAASAILKILAMFGEPNRTIWYIVDKNNQASYRLAKKCGFEFFAEGKRLAFLNLPFLSFYQIK